MHQDIEKTLLSEAQIAARVQELGKIIARDYAELGDLVMIGVLKGCTMFMMDSGLTLAYLHAQFLKRNPASMRICTLLNKPARRDPAVGLSVDYLGFDIPNEFVVGYGLDYAENYRNLPYIGVLKPEIYTH
jgi:hypoxanthine-guanine phosphoribosyltransferase